jgi:hypothetical protein
MTKNQTIDSETCVYKIHAMKSISLDEKVEHCRLCTREYELTCPDYEPISKYQEPIRRGINVMLVYGGKK